MGVGHSSQPGELQTRLGAREPVLDEPLKHGRQLGSAITSVGMPKRKYIAAIKEIDQGLC